MKNVNSTCFKGGGDNTSDFGVGGAAKTHKFFINYFLINKEFFWNN